MSDNTVGEQAQKLRQQGIDRLRSVIQCDLTPREIAEKLRERVIGQDSACEAIAVRLRQHLLQVPKMFGSRYLANQSWRPDDLGGILLLGPTGCGKTHLMRTATDVSSLVFHAEDAAGLSETAYVGRDVSDLVTSLVQSAHSYRPLAESALLFIDEVDKLRFRPDAAGKDVTGEGVQRSLLALLDGSDIGFGFDERTRSRGYTFRTDALLIVLGGAFAGLDEIIAKRLGGGKSRMGFGYAPTSRDEARREADLLEEVAAEDLIQYGFMPELVGRLRDFVVIRPLNAGDLERIMLHPEHGPLAAYQKMAEAEGFRFELTEELVGEVVDSALGSGQGARVLRRAMARVTRRALYEVPSLCRTRGEPTVRLSLDALEDGSYEIIQGTIRHPQSQTSHTLGDTLLAVWLEDEAGVGNDTQQARSQATDEQPEPDPELVRAIEEAAETLAAAIAKQAEADGHEAEYGVEVQMQGSELRARRCGHLRTPAARVTLWIRSPIPDMPPPQLHGGRLRAYARRADIDDTDWHLLKGARSYGCKSREDGLRWRRHVIYLGLNKEAVGHFASSED